MEGGDCMDELLGLLKIIVANVASYFVYDWLKKLFLDDD